MSYWSFEQRASDDDVVHYGRKGMKWYQNIFGDKSSSIKKKKSIKKIKTEESINRSTRWQQFGVLGASTIAIGAAHINYLFNTEVRRTQLNKQKRNIRMGAAAITAILEGKRIYQINNLKKQQGS